MTNAVIIAVVVAVVGAAIGYIVKEKKKGAACIGCPSSGSCNGGCGCGCHTDSHV